MTGEIVVAARFSTGFAINEAGVLKAWGGNAGRHGDGSTGNKKEIMNVSTKKWKTISAGLYHAIAIDDEGLLYVTGTHNYGQLGNGSTSGTTTHWTKMMSIRKFIACAASNMYFSFAIEDDGSLWVTGYKSGYALGTSDISTWTKVEGRKYKKIACGRTHSFVIDVDGYLFVCGSESNGALGLGATNSEYKLTQVDTRKYKEVACGDSHSLAIDEDGYLWGCGLGEANGTGTTTAVRTLTKIGGETKFKKIACGTYHSLAIDEEGYVYSWGVGSKGELANGKTESIKTPQKINENKYQAIAAGERFSVLVAENGDMYTCGDTSAGRTANGTDSAGSQLQLYLVANLSSNVTRYLISKNNIAYTIENSTLKSLGAITTTNAATLFTSGLETITKEDCILVGQQLGKSKIIKMDV